MWTCAVHTHVVQGLLHIQREHFTVVMEKALLNHETAQVTKFHPHPERFLNIESTGKSNTK